MDHERRKTIDDAKEHNTGSQDVHAPPICVMHMHLVLPYNLTRILARVRSTIKHTYKRLVA